MVEVLTVSHELGLLDAALAERPGGPEGDAGWAAGWAAGLVQRFAALQSEVDRQHAADGAQVRAWLAAGALDPGQAQRLRSQHHAVADALREGAVALDRLAIRPTAATAREVRAVLSAVRDVVDQHLAHQERLLALVWQG
jgi:hypothetical protein